MKGRSAVSIVGVEDEGVKSAVRRALRLIGGVRGIVKPGDKVLIKPNYMMSKHPRTAVTTDPRVVEAVADTVVEAGGNPIISEGSVVGHDTGVSFRVVGAREISERTGVPLIDLNRDEAVEVEVPGGKALRSVKIARTVLECDRIIGVPKIKTHHSTLVTCCLKNMKGVIPGREKHVTHLSGLHQAIVDLNKVVKPDLSIVDGILSMEGPGPGFGRPVPTNLIVAGFDPVAVDSTVCRIMDIDPSDVLHIRLAAEQGLGVMEAGAIEIRGIGIEEAMRHFVRPPVTIASLEKFAYQLEGFLRRILRRDFSIQRWVGRSLGSKPEFSSDACTGCRRCLEACPIGAIAFDSGLPTVDYGRCMRCYCCVESCPSNAFRVV